MRTTAADLIDFPVSWDWWRHYCRYYDSYDPGPNEPEDNTDSLRKKVEELEQEIEHLKSYNESGRYKAPVAKNGHFIRRPRRSRGVQI
jgi:hypothetical protein